MEKVICGFCRRGDEARDACGKLHVEKIDGGTKQVAAHHKCMQYSAQLIQYKFSHFGGFKIDKVLEEMKRGRFIKCHICKKDKECRGKWTGATSGCAVRKCNKSFHYYCAKVDPNTITKRMVVKYKKEQKEVVMYRVFCCQEHEDHFKKNKGDLVLPKKGLENSDISDSEEDGKSDEENDDREIYSAENMEGDNSDRELPFSMMTQDSPRDKQKSSTQETPDSDKTDDWYAERGSDKDIGQNHLKLGDCFTNSVEIENNLSIVSENSFVDNKSLLEDTGSAKSSRPSRTSKGSTSSPRLHQNKKMDLSKKTITCDLSKSMVTDFAVKKVSDQAEVKEDKGTTNGRSPRKDRVSTVLMSPKTSEHKSPKKSDDPFSDATLVITAAKKAKQSVKLEIKKMAEHSNVVFWLDGEHDLTEEHIPYLMNDISQLIIEEKYNRVVKLLTDPKELKSHLEIHNYALKLHQSLDNSVVSLMKESMFTAIKSNLTNAKKKKMSLCELVDVKVEKALLITLNKDTDPDGKLRKSLGVGFRTNNFYPWSPTTFKRKSCTYTGIRDHNEQDVNEILKWIKDQSCPNSPVVLKPEDDILLATDGSWRLTDVVATSLAKNSNNSAVHENTASEIVVCFRAMDSQVVDYQQFVCKTISHLIREKRDTVCRMICLLDLDSLKNKSFRENIISDDVRELCEKMTIGSVSDPSKKEVTCIIVDVTLQNGSRNGNCSSDTEGASKSSSPYVNLQRSSLTPTKTKKRLSTNNSPGSNKRRKLSDNYN